MARSNNLDKSAIAEVREDAENIMEAIRNVDDITDAANDVPALVEEADEILERVRHLEEDVNNLTDEVNQVTEEVQLRVEVRLEVAMVTAFAALGASELFRSGDPITGYAFLGLSGLFFIGFIETIVKKKRDLGYVVGKIFG
jgi:hypothetical protein